MNRFTFYSNLNDYISHTGTPGTAGYKPESPRNDHKYVEIRNGRYIYPEDIKREQQAKQNQRQNQINGREQAERAARQRQYQQQQQQNNYNKNAQAAQNAERDRARRMSQQNQNRQSQVNSREQAEREARQRQYQEQQRQANYNKNAQAAQNAEADRARRTALQNQPKLKDNGREQAERDAKNKTYATQQYEAKVKEANNEYNAWYDKHQKEETANSKAQKERISNKREEGLDLMNRYKGDFNKDFYEVAKSTGNDNLYITSNGDIYYDDPKNQEKIKKINEDYRKAYDEYNSWVDRYEKETDQKAKLGYLESALYAKQKIQEAQTQKDKLDRDMKEDAYTRYNDVVKQMYSRNNQSTDKDTNKDDDSNIFEKSWDWLKKKFK